MKYFLLTVFIFCFSLNIISQTEGNKEKALQLVEKGIKLVDKDKIDDGLKLMYQAWDLDSTELGILYEIGFAYSKKGEYRKVIDLLEPYKFDPRFDKLFFQMLGNNYDYAGNTHKAMITYMQGLTLFPDAGNLYQEMGVIELNQKNYDSAVVLFEKGIEVDPKYPTNYFNLANLYCFSDQKVWGLIYGEIFMNLERATKKTAVMSKILYYTYEKGIKFKDDEHINVSFFKTLNINELESSMFCTNFEMCYALSAVQSDREINIKNLHKIREAFIKQWFKMGFDKKYPNVLFDWNKTLLDKGFLKDYDYWLFRAEEDEFNDYIEDHPKKMVNFLYWFRDNKINISKDAYFTRKQYEIDSLRMNWKTEDDFKNSQQRVINCINWLEENPCTKDEQSRKKIAAYVLIWFTKTTSIQLNVTTDVIRDVFEDSTYKYHAILFGTFLSGKGLYLIEHNNSEDGYKANLRGVTGMLTLYDAILKESPGAISDIMEKYKAMQQDGSLEKYIESVTPK